MTPANLGPIEYIALDIARADMHYVATSLLGLPHSAVAAETALLQYGAMTAYEAQLHFGKTLGWDLSAEWDAETAKAARMSSKFFADTKRSFEDIVTHFDQLLQANHGAFFPADRRGRFLDFLRDDLSVVTLDGNPYTSLISAHYLTGLRPDQVGDFATVGSAIRQLSTGVDNVAGALLHRSGIDMHPQVPAPHFNWLDGKSRVAMPRLFGGALDPPLAAALLTVQSIASSAVRSVSRSLCGWCEAAAQKHRFVALFQSLTALDVMRHNGVRARNGTEMMEFLDDPESVWVLGQSKFRNGLVHLGLQDIASSLGPGSSTGDAVFTYTGQQPNVVAARVLDHLTRFADVLTTWALSPTDDGRSFLAAMRPASRA